MSRATIYVLLVVAAVAFAAYWIFSAKLPLGVQPKGDEQSPFVAYASLATSVVSLLTAMFGFAREFIARRKNT
jgi:drug/metabolite transporter (DMT)-like permease